MKRRNIGAVALTFVLLLMLVTPLVGALPIEVTDPTPANGAIDITPSVILAITSTVNSSNGSSMMGFMWTNISGVYAQGNWVGPFTNTTINWQMDASDYSTKYYWGVYVNDSWGNDINQSWDFTTEDAPAPTPPVSLTDAIVPVVMAMVTLMFILGLIGLVMKSFERWGK